MEEDKPKKKTHSAEKHQYMEHKSHKTHEGYKIATWSLVGVCSVLLILFVASLLTNGFSGSSSAKELSAEEVKAKTVAAVSQLVQGQSVEVKSITEENGIYSIELNVGGQTFNSYATKDGELLFPSAVNMNEPQTGTENQGSGSEPTPSNVPKSDKPVVELFVMSHCPFGTQAEKGILPAVRTLGDNIDFKVRFVYYAMHGEVEVVEQLNQYCIQKEEPEVFLKYLACFLNASDSEGCMKSTGVNKAKLSACYAQADEQFDVTKNLEDRASWLSGRFPKFNTDLELNQKYGIQGSPTLVINGVQSNAGRDSASYLRAICASFNNAPEECSTQLSSASPGPGFGYDSVGSAQAAGCGV